MLFLESPQKLDEIDHFGQSVVIGAVHLLQAAFGAAVVVAAS